MITIYPTKTCNKCKTEKSLDEYHKDKHAKNGHKATCIMCMCEIYIKNIKEITARNKKYRAENPKKVRAQKKKYRVENPKTVNAYNKKWRKENPEAVKAMDKKWADGNPEKVRAKGRKWRKNNPDKIAAKNATRRAAKLNRSPVWADKTAIKKIYLQAKLLGELTGVPYHVDHMVPLQGEKVSGLHVEYNLLAVPATVNLAKSNKFDSDEHGTQARKSV